MPSAHEAQPASAPRWKKRRAPEMSPLPRAAVPCRCSRSRSAGEAWGTAAAAGKTGADGAGVDGAGAGTGEAGAGETGAGGAGAGNASVGKAGVGGASAGETGVGVAGAGKAGAGEAGEARAGIGGGCWASTPDSLTVGSDGSADWLSIGGGRGVAGVGAAVGAASCPGVTSVESRYLESSFTAARPSSLAFGSAFAISNSVLDSPAGLRASAYACASPTRRRIVSSASFACAELATSTRRPAMPGATHEILCRSCAEFLGYPARSLSM